MSEEKIVVGTYYETPNGKIAYTYGFNGVSKTVMYRFDGEKGQLVSYDELRTWKRRQDLSDFPDALDPRLPYIFDLLWDIKYTSELKEIISGDREFSGDLSDLKEVMIEKGMDPAEIVEKKVKPR